MIMNVPHPEVMQGNFWNYDIAKKRGFILRYAHQAQRRMEKYVDSPKKWEKAKDDFEYWCYEYEFFSQWLKAVEEE